MSQNNTGGDKIPLSKGKGEVGPSRRLEQDKIEKGWKIEIGKDELRHKLELIEQICLLC